ncbi:hypothetical protein ZWY2020_003682 [Hordeum vulgare]|nr:hypothetical protein ZWY2020_003682 [Hordeum vulgare]
MFLQGAANVPCTLLHFVDGELIDVAKAKIVELGNRVFHGNPMPPTVYRVQLVRVLRGCDELLPPYRPVGADEDDVMTLSACLNWSMLWPKSQIRLGAGDTTPQTTPPVVPAPSHGKTIATLPPSADLDMHMAQDPDDDDDTISNVDKYINEHGYGDDDDLFGPPSQEPNPAKGDGDLAGTAEKPNFNTRRVFSSEETSPASAFTETQIAEVRNIIIPNTLKKVVSKQNSIPLQQKKQKGRKRKTNKCATGTARSVLRTGHQYLRILRGGCMWRRRLSENDGAYPVFVAKVPEGKGFVDSNIGRMIVLRFDDIFAMLNLYPLHYTFIRLFSLSMEMRIIRDKTPDIVIVDPFYMRDKLLDGVGDRQVASSYLEGVILANADKDNFLVPYFSDDTHCTLILLSPKYSVATYFDSDRQSKKDYANIRKVLDDVLPGYAKSGGTFRRPILRYGKHVFTHITMFPCVKQPPDSQKDAYYALHHMQAIVRDQHHRMQPNELKDWTARFSVIQDEDIRQEFFRIQSELAEIIYQDVLARSGQFYLNCPPSNSDINTMLQMQADNEGTFMTITKDGGFIHAPVPESTRKY